MNLNGKVAIITGSSRGIGEAAALYFARMGAKVVVNSRSLDACRAVAERIESAGGEALTVQADVGRLDQHGKIIGETLKRFGRIDTLVNNAAITNSVRALDVTEESWDAVFDVNMKGAFFLAQKAARAMADTGGGVIINLSSIYSTGSKGQIHYDCTKGGVISMTRSLAVELARHNIRVNCIAPGYIDTEMPKIIPPQVIEETLRQLPIRRLGKPDEVASLMAYLASDDAAYITGQTIHVNGGWYRI